MVLGNLDLLLNSSLSLLKSDLNESLVNILTRLNLSLLLIDELWLVDLLTFLDKSEVLFDSLEDLLHELFNGLDLVVLKTLVPLGELSVVRLLRLGLELLHILVNMGSEDSVPVGLGLVGLLLGIFVLGESWELLD